MEYDFPSSFITLFTVIDPIGTIPVFIAVTSKKNKIEKKMIAIKASLVSAGVLIFFALIGEIILDAIDIPLHSFQIAGGIILFLFSLTMIFGETKAEEEISQIDKKNDIAIFPLAMPSIASPGAILAMVLLTENSQHNIFDQSITIGIMLIIISLVFLLMIFSSWLYKFIGNGGAAIISRVMGIILCSVAIDGILGGVKIYFDTF